MNSNRKTARILEDVKINVKIKLSALWVTVMVLYAFGDIQSFYRPGIIEEILAGKIAGNEINQVFLLMAAISVVIPIIMIFLSLVLKPEVNRWANIIVGIIYTGYVIIFMIGDGWAYYYFYSIIEIVMTLLIVWHALKWPKQEG